MTTVEALYRYELPPSEKTLHALDKTREVYGIHGVHLDAAAKTLRVEYDATRLTGPAVYQLMRRTGLALEEASATAAEAIEAPATA